MTTLKNAKYTITTSLSEQESSIYIKVVNNISYATYEGTFERSAFRVSFEIAGIYRLINKCFAVFTDGGDAKYSVRMEIESNALRMTFHCNIEEFLVVEFEIRLKEKTIANDVIISAELEKQKQLVETLTDCVERQRQMIERLSNRLDQEERKTTDIVNSLTTEIAIQKQNVDKLTANIHNSYALIGYKLSASLILPVFELPETTSIFNPMPYHNCIIVSQLRYLRNITKINIMNLVSIMFIFDNVEVSELYHKCKSAGDDRMLNNIDFIVRENNPKYFVVSGDVFGYVNGRLNIFNQPYDVRTYVKNGLKKLYEKLLDVNIELTMPNELLDFALK